MKSPVARWKILAGSALSIGIALCALALVRSLSTPQTLRLPAQADTGSLERSQVLDQSLHEKMQSIRLFLADPAQFKVESCPEVLAQIYHELWSITPTQQSLDEIRDQMGSVVHLFFETRQTLRSRLADFHQAGALQEPCVDQARNLMRALRFGEEYLAEQWAHPAPYDPKKPAPYLGGEEPYLQVPAGTGRFDVSELRSGDLLLSRGNAITSAAIARLAKVPGQFSHLAQLYIDPSSKKRWILEAHIEVGTTVRPYEEYAADGNFRVMVLRMRDPEHQLLAEKAATIQFRRLKAAADRNSPVPYDFGMRLSDSSELFCSEVVYEGFQKASQGSFTFPLFLSRIEPKNRDFVERIGVQEFQSFLPSDLDVDPRFEVLAEWRDVSRIGDVRRKDIVLDRFYAWSDDHGYCLGSNLDAWFKKTVIWSLRRWPVFSKLLEKRFPLNMSQSLLQTVSILTALGDALLQEAENLDQQALRSRGLPLSFSELAASLDLTRVRDLEKYENWQRWRKERGRGVGRYSPVRPPKPAFTHLFHP